jgi:RNA polymerase sigma-70 factor (ECF subfamily)
MDRDVVVGAQQGDRAAFETLTLAHHPRLYRVALGILRDPQLAEDATQQAFLDIWRRFDRLSDPGRFDGWSYRLLVHACYAEARRKPRWIGGSDTSRADEPVTGDAFGLVVDRDQLERGFERLSVDQRAVVVLHYLLDMTLEQVADALGVRRGTVHSRLNRALKTLRAALEADARPAIAPVTDGVAR